MGRQRFWSLFARDLPFEFFKVVEVWSHPNGSCCQKCSQLHSGLCIPAVPFALDQAWWKTISQKKKPNPQPNKNPQTTKNPKSPQNKKPHKIPNPIFSLWSAQSSNLTQGRGQEHGAGTNCWRACKLLILAETHSHTGLNVMWQHSWSGKAMIGAWVQAD